MNRSATGTYHTTATAGEQVRAFVPLPLPPVPPLEIAGARQRLLERATLAVGRLDSVSTLLPDPQLFLYAYAMPFYAENRLDSCSKIEFFGRLANAANRCITQGHTNNAANLCRAVLHEAFAIYEEMESATFGSLAVAVGSDILDDFAAGSERTGYVSIENTLQFFKEQGFDCRDD